MSRVALAPDDPERLLPELGLSPSTHWAWAVVTRDDPNLPTGSAFGLVMVHHFDGTTERHSDLVGPISKQAWPDRLAAVEMDWVGPVITEPTIAPALGPCLWLGDLAIQGWWRKAREPSRPVFAEVRWHPNRGHELALRWTDPAVTADDIRRAREGLLLLTGIPTIGRPYDETFWRELETWVRDHCRQQRGRLPTQRETANQCTMRIDTLKEKFRARHPGLAWREWVRRVCADIPPLSPLPDVIGGARQCPPLCAQRRRVPGRKVGRPVGTIRRVGTMNVNAEVLQLVLHIAWDAVGTVVIYLLLKHTAAGS